ncbi:MAG TPA: sulfotransferase family 2 domain-containing protein [Verrucomicrobiae bacterium]|nr:sulfotransferase family 2 domain-containing protein [Verrucomicrobiae bacterium]
MIVFLHIPKTAGSSFQFILENSFGFSYCHTNHASFHDHTSHSNRKPFDQADFDFAKKVFPRLKSLAGHNLVNALALSVPEPFHITFLREPVARVLSQYQERTLVNRKQGRPAPGFAEALRTDGELENLQVKLMAGERNLDKAKYFLEKCSFVGLTEKFDLSLQVLKHIYPGKLNLQYQKRRVAADNTIKKSIEADPQLMELAREHNRLDLELYEFAKNEIFPKFCEKAGINPEAKFDSLGNASHQIKIKWRLSRFYNRSVYRQLCKIRNKLPGRRSF